MRNTIVARRRDSMLSHKEQARQEKEEAAATVNLFILQTEQLKRML
jgi:hypothetical protein